MADESLPTSFDALPLGAALVDPAGIIVSANRALGEMTGLSRETLVGWPLAALLFAPDGQGCLEWLAHLATDEDGEFAGDVRYVGPGDLPKWGRVTAVRLRRGADPRWCLLCLRNVSDERATEERVATLQQLTACLSAAVTPDDVVRAMFRNMIGMLGSHGVIVALLDDEGKNLEIVRAAGFSDDVVQAWHRFPVATPVPIAEAVRTGNLVAVSSLEEMSTRFPALVADTRAEGCQAVACVPIVSSSMTLGGLGLAFQEPRALSEVERTYQLAVGRQCGEALARARLYEAERRARQTAEVLRSAAMAVTETLELQTVLAKLLEHLRRVVPFDSACVFLIEADSQCRVRTATGYEARTSSGFAERLLGRTFDTPAIRLVVETGSTVLIPDVRHWQSWVPEAETAYIRSWLGVPLTVGGRVIGLYSLDKASPEFFTREHVRFAETLAGHASVAIENARLFEQARRQKIELQRLSHRLARAQETERRAIAYELHDEVGQLLTSAKLTLEANRGASGALDQVCDTLDRLVHKVRAMSLDLRPAILDDLGLLPALLWQVERFRESSALQVTLVHAGIDRRFDRDIETVVYRIVQEALTNVARHAGVDRADVHVIGGDDYITLVVADAGGGFDVLAAQQASGSNGLLIMQERAAGVDGELTIESSPGRGTRVLADVPVNAPERTRR